MIYHVIGMVLASILASIVMMLGNNKEYVDATSFVLFGSAVALTVLPMVIVLIPSSLYKSIAGKRMPCIVPIFWLTWTILAAANIYDNYS